LHHGGDVDRCSLLLGVGEGSLMDTSRGDVRAMMSQKGLIVEGLFLGGGKGNTDSGDEDSTHYKGFVGTKSWKGEVAAG